MPSCHSVHDLELAVQDLGAHLLQDNIRCLINSMPDRVAACISAGDYYRFCLSTVGDPENRDKLVTLKLCREARKEYVLCEATKWSVCPWLQRRRHVVA
ncbi:hypothetical protein TNCV_1048811 [Trichonephila clavipes]|nr:hypothetical protein TNCV_1048811 [Trichonephila clavipes]